VEEKERREMFCDLKLFNVATGLLYRIVTDRATEVERLGHAGGLGRAEILVRAVFASGTFDQPKRRDVAIGEEDVGGLDIAMDNPFLADLLNLEGVG
jgi:hypothetical protein